MDLMTYVLTCTASFTLAILCIGRIRGLAPSAMATIIASSLFCALVVHMERNSGTRLWPIYPLVLLFGASLTALLIYGKEIIPVVHEGEVAVTYITCAYLLTQASESLGKWAFGLSLPLTFWLIKELVSSRKLTQISRFVLGFTFSLTYVAISAYQIYHSQSIFYSSVASTRVWTFFMDSFITQMSIFWALLHAWRLLFALGLKDKRINKEVFAEFVTTVSEENVPATKVALACLVHALPLMLNSYFQWVPAPRMIAYACLVSPVFIEILLGFKQEKQEPAEKTQKSAA